MWTLDDKSLFHAGALGAMRSVGTIDNPELFVDAAIEQFQPDESKACISELQRFMEWVKTLDFHVREYPIDEIMVSLTAKAGDGSVSISLRSSLYWMDDAAVTHYASDTEIDVQAVALFKKCFHAYTSVSIALPNTAIANTQSANSTGNAAAASVTKETHDCETIMIGNWKGKKTYRVPAGWFSQYGAAVYPETLKAMNQSGVLDLPEGTHPFKHTIDVEVKDGKPKVVAIR